MNDEEKKIEEEAFEWIKQHKKELFAKFADLEIYSSDSFPTTVFMAGSPGAGKTEFSKRLAEIFKQKPIIIDADEIRKMIPGYIGKNSYLFQKAANKGVNFLYDYARSKNLNVILDGTFAYGGALENIENSLKHNRNVEIYYIYQDPILSWKFTKEREIKEKRNVPKKVFISTYLKSIENVASAKAKFKTRIKLNIVIKDFEKGLNALELNKESLENHIPKVYTGDELERLLE